MGWTTLRSDLSRLATLRFSQAAKVPSRLQVGICACLEMPSTPSAMERAKPGLMPQIGQARGDHAQLAQHVAAAQQAIAQRDAVLGHGLSARPQR